MRSARGIGSVYQPSYIDKQTGERKKSAVGGSRTITRARSAENRRATNGSTLRPASS